MTVSTPALRSGAQYSSTSATSSSSTSPPAWISDASSGQAIGWRAAAESASASAAMFAERAAAASRSAPRSCTSEWSELHLPDRVLDLADDRIAEALALVRLEALERGDDACHHERDKEDQSDVLDRALARVVSKAANEPKHLHVYVAERPVHVDSSLGRRLPADRGPARVTAQDVRVTIRRRPSDNFAKAAGGRS